MNMFITDNISDCHTLIRGTLQPFCVSILLCSCLFNEELLILDYVECNIICIATRLGHGAFLQRPDAPVDGVDSRKASKLFTCKIRCWNQETRG